MRIPMLKIRRSGDRLIFNIGIPILVRWHLYIEKAPRSLLPCWNEAEYGMISYLWRTVSLCVTRQFKGTLSWMGSCHGIQAWLKNGIWSLKHNLILLMALENLEKTWLPLLSVLFLPIIYSTLRCLTNFGRVTHMSQWDKPSMVQIMACSLIGAKALSEPMLIYN